MNDTLAAAERTAEIITKRAGGNFSVGFRFLPRAKRKAVYAAYAFCRLTDDLADEHEGAEASELLDRWEEELDATYDGRPSHEVSIALARALQTFPIPKAAFAGLIDGCRDDLAGREYETFGQLMEYVEKVAWTISDISLSIFRPLADQETTAFDRGRDLATALQLTNICRDVGDDLPRRRIYLPKEELARFGVEPEQLFERRVDERFLDLMQFQIDRAGSYFDRARELPRLLESDARLAVSLMASVYEAVLDKVREAPEVVLDRRVALTLKEKFAIIASRAREFGRRQPA